MNTSHSHDAAVQATNDEALTAKLSAVSRGYFKDPFISAFCDALQSPQSNKSLRRQPMINRGTFARVSFVRQMVNRFLSATKDEGLVQIVSFGAGHDTLPFIVLSEHGSAISHYVELDFDSVIRSKVAVVAAVPIIAGIFERLEKTSDGIIAHSKGTIARYVASACDLRDLSSVRRVLRFADLSTTAPTLFIAECVLVYLPPADSDALIKLASLEYSGPRAFVNYEPIMPHDPFGKQMVRNIALRGSPLMGIERYASVQEQKKRFLDAKWQDVDAISMLDAFTTWLDTADVQRINALEMLDEVEEWRLMMSHYCFVWARIAPTGHEQFLDKLRI